MACLLHDEPASYVYMARLRNVHSGAVVKASINCANIVI